MTLETATATFTKKCKTQDDFTAAFNAIAYALEHGALYGNFPEGWGVKSLKNKYASLRKSMKPL